MRSGAKVRYSRSPSPVGSWGATTKALSSRAPYPHQVLAGLAEERVLSEGALEGVALARAAGDGYLLRPYAYHARGARARAGEVRSHAGQSPDVRIGDKTRAVDFGYAAGDEIGLADEGRDECVCRMAVHVVGAADLDDVAGRQHREALGHRQRFLLVVGDVDGGDARLAVDALDLRAHLEAELGVEVGERLVEQETAGAR